MHSRVTQLLLASIALLLVALLLRPIGVVPVVHAESAPAVAEVLRARQIELVSATGQVVAQLYTSDDGSGQLRLRSGSGEVRVKLGAADDGSGLVLMDDEAEPALWLSAKPSATKLTLAQRGKDQRVLQP